MNTAFTDAAAILHYARKTLFLSSCEVQNGRILREWLVSPFAGIMLRSALGCIPAPREAASVIISDHFSEYFRIPRLTDNTVYLFGPVLRVKLNNVAFTNYSEKYSIRFSHLAAFTEYLRSLPVYSEESESHTVSLLYELLNGTPCSRECIEIIDLNRERGKAARRAAALRSPAFGSEEEKLLQEYYDTGNIFYHARSSSHNSLAIIIMRGIWNGPLNRLPLAG